MPEQDQEVEPDWLEQLRACCRQWKVRRGQDALDSCSVLWFVCTLLLSLESEGMDVLKLFFFFGLWALRYGVCSGTCRFSVSKGLAVPEGCRASHRAKLSLFWLKEGRQGLVGEWWSPFAVRTLQRSLVGVTLWVYSCVFQLWSGAWINALHLDFSSAFGFVAFSVSFPLLPALRGAAASLTYWERAVSVLVWVSPAAWGGL